MEKTQKNRMTSYVWKLLLLIVLLAVPLIFSGSDYIMLIICIAMIYLVAVSGLDILFGYCGQISLGHAAFYAIGAYTSAILYNRLQVPMILAIIAGAILGALVGALLAYPASNLVFHFLSLATVAFGEIVYQVLIHSPGKITGNFNGMFTDRMRIFGLELSTYKMFYYFMLVIAALFIIGKIFLAKSRVGRAFTAIRDNSVAASGMGINVRKYKILSFATSAFYTAFAGGLYMFLACYVHPDQFMQKQSVMFLTMLLFGGTGSVIGPIIGVLAVTTINESLRFLEEYQMLIYGILLLIVILAMPGGIAGTVKKAYWAIRRRVNRTSQEG